ncbi:BTAD domain-containing putative transcriptional regulator [Kutzneria sp. NPDC052558]|uniref:AfsR/SARP family transcriptional regulator n=1 Tax=Kutzneria sp. NPDC052558 TaxID=3364121 RepID=UPI0037CBB392
MTSSGGKIGEEFAGDLRIALLGPPAAALNGRDLRLGPPRQWAVLALLAARAGQAVARDEIISAVWGAAQPVSAESGVHTYVSGLRRLVEPARTNRQPGQILVSHDAAYELRVPKENIDIWEFDRLFDAAESRWRHGEFEASLTGLESALALWRGPAFSGIPGPFAETEQVRYDELRLAAAERRAEVLMAVGRQIEAIPDLQSLTRQNPLRERARHLLIQALYRSDRQADALAEFQETRRCLVEQLGVEPGHALQTLHSQILRGEPADDLGGHDPGPVSTRSDDHMVPSQLPRRNGRLTGRTSELKRLNRLLDSPTQVGDPLPVVLITGPAGVGKTTLAVSCAHSVAETFDCQMYVNLHGFDQERAASSSAVVLGGLLEALGLSSARMPADVDQLSALYRSATAAKRLLLVLDNAESAAQVRPLLPGGAGSAVIVTSRSRLDGLVARDGAHPVVLMPLSARDSIDLLADVIGEHRIAGEPEAAARVTALCAGLPLAIRVAAERIATRSHLALSDVAADLAEEAGRLDALTIRGDDETSARTVFSWSYRHLDAEHARSFRILGLHPAVDFGVGAAAAMLDVAISEAQEQLDMLASVHLVEEIRHGRYRFHDLILLYAKELCVERDDPRLRSEAVERLLQWYLAMAVRASDAAAPWRCLPDNQANVQGLQAIYDRDDALKWFHNESSALSAAAELAAKSGRLDVAWQIPLAEFNYLHLVKNWSLWAAVYGLALDSVQGKGQPVGEAWMHHGLSVADHGRGEFTGAYEHSRRALEIRRALGDREGEAWSLHGLRIACLGLERLEEAERHLIAAIGVHLELGDRYGKTVTTLFLAETKRELGQYSEAIELAGTTLDDYEKLDSPHGMGQTLKVLGRSHAYLHQYELAEHYYQRALRVCHDAGDEVGEEESLCGLADVMTAVGANDRARVYLTQALEILQRRGDPQAEDVRSQLATT